MKFFWVCQPRFVASRRPYTFSAGKSSWRADNSQYRDNDGWPTTPISRRARSQTLKPLRTSAPLWKWFIAFQGTSGTGYRLRRICIEERDSRANLGKGQVWSRAEKETRSASVWNPAFFRVTSLSKMKQTISDHMTGDIQQQRGLTCWSLIQ